MCVCINFNIDVRIRIRHRICVCVFEFIFTCVYVCVYVHVYVYACVYVCAYAPPVRMRAACMRNVINCDAMHPQLYPHLQVLACMYARRDIARARVRVCKHIPNNVHAMFSLLHVQCFLYGMQQAIAIAPAHARTTRITMGWRLDQLLALLPMRRALRTSATVAGVVV